MRCFPFDMGIHYRRKTDFFPEKDTTMSCSGFEPEPFGDKPRVVAKMLAGRHSNVLQNAVAAFKTKYRSQPNIENVLRVSISNRKPSFEKLSSARQAHGSR
ncbi:hypothetical protein TNCV_3818261 [Trichonephila clavipes]|nr:hypothetical protein TNCV_3818261 [Trichonephila clavipes]